MKKKTIIAAIILLPVLIFCLGGFHFSDHYIIGQDIPFEKISKIHCGFWKYSGGYGTEDFLEFNGNYCKIKNDTLYINEKPEAKVIGLVHRCIIGDYKLTIQSFDGQKGFYVSK